jgi:hypothetical protein
MDEVLEPSTTLPNQELVRGKCSLRRGAFFYLFNFSR